MFSSEDILWVRNVKRKHGPSAYLEEERKDEFILHWSSRYKNGDEAEKPKIGDIILIFQVVENYKGVQLTHLVTPITDKSIDCFANNKEFRWGRRVKVLARVPNGNNPKPDKFKFDTVNQTHSYEIKNIRSDLSIPETQNLIWNCFDGYFNDNISELENSIVDLNIINEDLKACEGDEVRIVKEHVFRERNSNLVDEKKDKAKKDGKMQCECCNFDFSEVYPDLGEGFIECHHTRPISHGARVTSLDDLVLVCSNCHRMLHRKDKKGRYKTVEELREIIHK
jgi:hypothetical protein